jgi:hypothetical protein
MMDFIVSQCRHLGESFRQYKRLFGILARKWGIRSAVSRLSVMPKKQPSLDGEGNVVSDPLLVGTRPIHRALTFDLSS